MIVNLDEPLRNSVGKNIGGWWIRRQKAGLRDVVLRSSATENFFSFWSMIVLQCWLVSAVQHESALCERRCPLALTSSQAPRPTPPAGHRAPDWALGFAATARQHSIPHGVVGTCPRRSPGLSRPLPPTSARLVSESASLFLPCKRFQLHHFSRFHIYALVWEIRLSLSDSLHSVADSAHPRLCRWPRLVPWCSGHCSQGEKDLLLLPRLAPRSSFPLPSSNGRGCLPDLQERHTEKGSFCEKIWICDSRGKK